MLPNNNQAIVRKLAGNSLRRDRKQFGTLFFTILLSAFMLLSVLALGSIYLKESR